MGNLYESELVATPRGTFEVFRSGQGQVNPICVTHYYSAFTKRGNYFADRFADCGHVVLVNLKECGNSAHFNHENELSMIETVNDLEAIRNALGFEKWTFAGHSTGGMLGLHYGIRHPEALDQLIVVGAAASNEYMQSMDSIYCRDNVNNRRLREIFSILKSTTASQEEKMQAAREWTEMSLHHPEKWDEYFHKPSSGRTVQIRLDYYNKTLSSYNIKDHLHSIETPTLILCGRFDSQCPVQFSEEMHHLIPDSKLHIFEDSNHSPHLEEPGEFIAVVERFLKND